MRKYKSSTLTKRQKRLRRLYVFVFTIILLAVLVLVYFDKVVNPVIVTTSETKIKMLTSRAVNSAISDILSESDIYDKLVTISSDENGKITMIQANTTQINLLSKEISKRALSEIESLGEQGIPIPAGTFSGMPLLMGKGPTVLIKVTPLGNLDCLFKSEFIEAGINQTLHRIYLEISASVNLILPIFEDSIRTFTQVIICESVIVGEVPEFYFNNSMSSLLDLVPDSN